MLSDSLGLTPQILRNTAKMLLNRGFSSKIHHQFNSMTVQVATSLSQTSSLIWQSGVSTLEKLV